jgi:hypothetical protein
MARSGGRRPARATKKRPARPVSAPAPAAPPRTFRLGLVPGVMPGKWVAAWGEQMPHVRLELRPLAVAEQHAAIERGMRRSCAFRSTLPVCT